MKKVFILVRIQSKFQSTANSQQQQSRWKNKKTLKIFFVHLFALLKMQQQQQQMTVPSMNVVDVLKTTTIRKLSRSPMLNALTMDLTRKSIAAVVLLLVAMKSMKPKVPSSCRRRLSKPQALQKAYRSLNICL